MINWNGKDINIEDIIVYSDILDVNLLHNYRLYGSINPFYHITFAFVSEYHPLFMKKLPKLRTFFSDNGFLSNLIVNDDYHWQNKSILRIGLNETIRKDLKLSSAILKTAVGVGEGKIPLTLKQTKSKILI